MDRTYYGYIYLTKNIVNGKIYIGQHKGCFDKTYKGSGTVIKRAVKKYGVNNFETIVLCWCYTKEQLDSSEKNFIKLFSSRKQDVGYNIAVGGCGSKGHKHTEEWKQHISKLMTGRFISDETRKKIGDIHRGMKMTDEQRKHISEGHKGQRAWNKGIPMSEKTKKKLSQLRKGRVSPTKGKKYTEEEKQRFSYRYNSRKKQVYQYTKDGQFVAKYLSLREVENQLGYDRAHISACCRGERKTAYGFVWSYIPK